MSEDFYNRSVLVTGGMGFIGSHLAERLAWLGARVTVVDNLQAGCRDHLAAVADAIQTIEGDVCDPATMEDAVRGADPQIVFHLAANASVPGSVQNPLYDFQANCVGTFTLLNALRGMPGVESVVVASSGAVYGEPASFPIVETDPLMPISPYGASKVNTEVVAQMFRRVYGVPCVIARIFNTYGPRMARFVVLDFLRKLQRDPTRLEILGTGQQIRDFTFVSDTVDGLLALAMGGAPGEAYNLSSGVSCSVTELAQRLIAALGMGGQTQISYTGRSWIGDAQRWEVSPDKIRRLGHRACVSLDEGLAQTIQWFMATEGAICADAR